MNMNQEARDHMCTLRLTEQENQIVADKMKIAGITDKSAYIRKMAISGYILKLEMPELKELISLMRYASNNINQIAKKANAVGIAEKELEEIRNNQERLWDGLNRVLKKLGEIP